MMYKERPFSNKTLFTEATYRESCVLTPVPGDGGAKFWKRSGSMMDPEGQGFPNLCSASIRNAILKEANCSTL